jgi:hypothetical protein
VTPARDRRPWADVDIDAAAALRGWTLAVLAGDDPGAVPVADEVTWRFFLTIERCAAPLARARDRPPPGPGSTTSLPEPTRRLIADLAALELQRAMAAAGEVDRLDALAEETGWAIVLLKGARVVADRPDLYIGDVDVLAPPDEARALVRALEADDYVRAAPDLPPRQDHRPHLSQRTLPGSIPVEVHQRIKHLGDPGPLLDRAVPCPHARALWQLRDDDHLEHLVNHLVLSHPDRIGRIRDTLVLQAALEKGGGLARAGLDAARRRVDPAVVDGLVAMAEGLRGAPVDPFRDAAHCRYALLSRFRGMPGARGTLVRASHIVSDGRGLLEEIRRAVTAGPLRGPSRNWWLTALGRAPLLGPALRVLARTGRALAGAALAAAVRLRVGRRTGGPGA